MFSVLALPREHRGEGLEEFESRSVKTRDACSPGNEGTKNMFDLLICIIWTELMLGLNENNFNKRRITLQNNFKEKNIYCTSTNVLMPSKTSESQVRRGSLYCI